MYQTCHLFLLCVSNSENYHLMCWNFKNYHLVYRETCLTGSRSFSSSPVNFPTNFAGNFPAILFPARTIFSVGTPSSFISFELLPSSPLSYTTFSPFLTPFCYAGDGGLVAREDDRNSPKKTTCYRTNKFYDTLNGRFWNFSTLNGSFQSWIHTIAKCDKFDTFWGTKPY